MGDRGTQHLRGRPMTPDEARKAVTDFLIPLALDPADENEIESLVDAAIRDAMEEMKLGAFGTAINQIRHDCANCEGAGWEPTADPLHPHECEYCGRPMAAVRTLMKDGP